MARPAPAMATLCLCFDCFDCSPCPVAARPMQQFCSRAFIICFTLGILVCLIQPRRLPPYSFRFHPSLAKFPWLFIHLSFSLSPNDSPQRFPSQRDFSVYRIERRLAVKGHPAAHLRSSFPPIGFRSSFGSPSLSPLLSVTLLSRDASRGLGCWHATTSVFIAFFLYPIVAFCGCVSGACSLSFSSCVVFHSPLVRHPCVTLVFRLPLAIPVGETKSRTFLVSFSLVTKKRQRRALPLLLLCTYGGISSSHLPPTFHFSPCLCPMRLNAALPSLPRHDLHSRHAAWCHRCWLQLEERHAALACCRASAPHRTAAEPPPRPRRLDKGRWHYFEERLH